MSPRLGPTDAHVHAGEGGTPRRDAVALTGRAGGAGRAVRAPPDTGGTTRRGAPAPGHTRPTTRGASGSGTVRSSVPSNWYQRPNRIEGICDRPGATDCPFPFRISNSTEQNS